MEIVVLKAVPSGGARIADIYNLKFRSLSDRGNHCYVTNCGDFLGLKLR